MELSDLRSFVAVAEELHFGRAAERLHVTQPPLSRQIRKLEDALGVKLFHRTTRRVDLTDAGREFLAEARNVLAAAERAVSRARSVERGETGRLAIGAVTPAIDGFLPELIREFRSRHPRVDVSLTEMDTTSQLDALRAERLHAAFVRLAEHDVRGLSTQVVRRERLVLALPRGHRLAAASTIPLASLAGEPVVALAPEVQPELHRRLVAACSDAGFAMRVTQTTRTVPTITALVAAGMGVAFVPESARSTRRTGVAWRPIRGRLPEVEISVAWRSWNASPALGHLRDLLKSRGVALRG
jgi:DNA-binding transcriptional LysR family regulator